LGGGEKKMPLAEVAANAERRRSRRNGRGGLHGLKDYMDGSIYKFLTLPGGSQVHVIP
jgi:hypothetical protein